MRDVIGIARRIELSRAVLVPESDRVKYELLGKPRVSPHIFAGTGGRVKGMNEASTFTNQGEVERDVLSDSDGVDN